MKKKNLLVEFVELTKSSIVRIDCPFIALGLVTNTSVWVTHSYFYLQLTFCTRVLPYTVNFFIPEFIPNFSPLNFSRHILKGSAWECRWYTAQLLIYQCESCKQVSYPWKYQEWKEDHHCDVGLQVDRALHLLSCLWALREFKMTT